MARPVPNVARPCPIPVHVLKTFPSSSSPILHKNLSLHLPNLKTSITTHIQTFQPPSKLNQFTKSLPQINSKYHHNQYPLLKNNFHPPKPPIPKFEFPKNLTQKPPNLHQHLPFNLKILLPTQPHHKTYLFHQKISQTPTFHTFTKKSKKSTWLPRDRERKLQAQEMEATRGKLPQRITTSICSEANLFRG